MSTGLSPNLVSNFELPTPVSQFSLSIFSASSIRERRGQLSLSRSCRRRTSGTSEALSFVKFFETNGGTCGRLHLKSLDSSENIHESVQIPLFEELRKATQIPEFASYPKISCLVDEFLRLPGESGLRAARRVLVLIRLETRENKFVGFRRTRLPHCFQFYENGLSRGKVSAWQLLLCRFEEVRRLPVDDQQLVHLQTVVLGDELLQNLDHESIWPTTLAKLLFPSGT